MKRIYHKQTSDTLVHERVEVERVSTTRCVDGGEPVTTTEERERRYVVFETTEATCEMLYNGRPLEVMFSIFYVSSGAVEEAQRYSRYYQLDESSPLVIVAKERKIRREYLDLGESAFSYYLDKRDYERTDKLVDETLWEIIWSSRNSE